MRPAALNRSSKTYCIFDYNNATEFKASAAADITRDNPPDPAFPY